MKASLIALSASAVLLLTPHEIAAQSSYETGTLVEIPVHASTAPADMIDSTTYLAGTDCWGAHERQRHAALVADLPDHSRVVIGFCVNGDKQFDGVALLGETRGSWAPWSWGVHMAYPCSISHVLMLTKPDGGRVFLEPGSEIPPRKFSGPARTVKFSREIENGKILFRIQTQNTAESERVFSAFQPPLQISPFSEEQIRSLCGTNKLSPEMTKKYCSARKNSASSGTVSDSNK
jgi:hypothetical protein